MYAHVQMMSMPYLYVVYICRAWYYMKPTQTPTLGDTVCTAYVGYAYSLLKTLTYMMSYIFDAVPPIMWCCDKKVVHASRTSCYNPYSDMETVLSTLTPYPFN